MYILLTRTQKVLLGGVVLAAVAILLSVWHSKVQKEEARLDAAAKTEVRKKAAADFQATESQRLREEGLQREQAELRRVDEKREELQAVLDRSVYDPYAVRLRNLRLVQGNGGYALCGDISAKVASGKYFPERAFAVTEFPLEKTTSQVIGVSKSGELPDPATTTGQLGSAGCQ